MRQKHFNWAHLSAFFAAAVLLACSPASADTLRVEFSSPANVESASAVVNPALGYVHPGLQVDSWDSGAGAGVQSSSFSVGDGRHGSFEPATYLKFDDGSYANDQILHINTDTYPDLQFSKFDLVSGWTIRPSGSRPLVIRSLSSVTVSGTVDCSGASGADVGPKAQTASGGSGHCGGSPGGLGGSVALAPTDGANAGGIASTRGHAATASGGGGGGGGGLANTAPAATAGGGGGAGGPGGQGSDSEFAISGGGAGGGGGYVYVNAGTPPAESSGAGGGAGGGSIYIYSVGDFIISGSVSANGGSGGNASGAHLGGAGGGGAGGSILLFSGGQFNVTGTVTAQGGSGGTSAAGPGIGGDGGTGRTWTTDRIGNPAGGGINPSAILLATGNVDYQTGTYQVVSTLYDLNVTKARLAEVTVDADAPAPSNVTIELATSEAPFASAAADWMASDKLSLLSGKRYARFRLTMNNQSASAPIKVRSLSLRYAAIDQEQFNFGSCQLVSAASGGSNGGSGMFFLAAICLPLLTGLSLRKRSPAEAEFRA